MSDTALTDTALTDPVHNAVQECEDSAVPPGPDPKKAAKLLTDAEWAEAMPPFCWIKIEYPSWTELEFEIALKYALRNSEGWVYRRDAKFVFERMEDYVLFKLWLSERPMEGDKTSLEVG